MSQEHRMRRDLKLLIVGGFVAVTACVVMVMEEVINLLPGFLINHPFELSIFGFVGLLAYARRYVKRYPNDEFADLLRPVVSTLDPAFEWVMKGKRPTIIVGGLVAALLLSWGPAYLTWPFWIDHDVCAGLAKSWNDGIFPWRDRATCQFPGEIYLFWVLGRVFGWGRPTLFFAVDLGMLLILGGATLVWSQRRLGGVLPGLIAYLSIVGAYTEFPFTHVAQRDWHAAILCALSLLAAQTATHQAGRWGSAILAGLAFVFRPHAAILVPATLAAVDEQTRPPRGPWARAVRPVLEWIAIYAAVVALGFAPLAYDNLLPDFVGAMRDAAASNGPYAQIELSRMGLILSYEIFSVWLIIVLGANLALATFGPTIEARRLARVWLLAVIGVQFYKVPHPVQHLYLDQPRLMILCLAQAPPLAWVFSSARIRAPLRLAIVATVIFESAPWWPLQCDPWESLHSLGPLVRGRAPVEPPLGCRSPYPRPDVKRYHYTWGEYCEALDYVRESTDSKTPLANLLSWLPFPSFNGPVGRPSALPYDALMQMDWFPNTDIDTPLAAQLEWAPGIVVIRDGKGMAASYAKRLPRTLEVIDRLYQRDAAFGEIEIWRRKSPPPPLSAPLPRAHLS